MNAPEPEGRRHKVLPDELKRVHMVGIGGAGMSGIARILNIVAVICDVISLVLSGILTGLNGVVLAQQCGHRGSQSHHATSVLSSTSRGANLPTASATFRQPRRSPDRVAPATRMG